MTRMIAALVLACALVACADEGASVEEGFSGPPPGAIRLSKEFSADFALVDVEGAAVADKDFRGAPMLVYFGFANCPDVCPAALGVMSAALDELGEDADRVRPIFITVDPERDDPETLKAYLAFDDRIIGLTGSVAAVEAAKDAYKVYANKVEVEGSAIGYTVDHLSLFYLIDADGNPRHALPSTRATPEDLAQLVRTGI